MMRLLWSLLLTVILLPALHHQVWAGGSDWRCGSRIVSVGMYQDDILALCGEPDSSRSWQEVYESDLIPQTQGSYRRVVTVTFEEWTYNPGPRRFLRFLTFRDGTLVKIETGGYGY